MSTFYKAFVLLVVAASAAALTTPHQARSALHHRSLAGRFAAPEPVPVAVSKPLRRRGASGRCRPRPTASASSSSTPAQSNPTPAPANVAPKPPAENPAPPASSSSSSPSPSPQPKPKQDNPPPPPPPAPSPPPPPSPPAKPAPGGPSFMYGTQTGDGTFYAAGLGACGITNSDNDHIVAVSHALFDSYPGYNGVNPNNNPICGKWIKATYQGKSTRVQVTDRCGGCDITGSLDFTPTAFNEIADPNVGRIHGMTWVWD